MKHYIHIPRTAGTSIAGAIEGLDISIHRHDLRDPNFKHYEEYANENDIALCFTRDPLTRAYSAYQYLKDGGLHLPDSNDAYFLGIKNLSFNEFVEKKLEDAMLWQIHFIPQNKWVRGARNLHIYRFENLDNEFKRMCKEHQLIVKNYPEINNFSNYKAPLDSVISRRVMKIIKKLYKDDYKMFNY